MSRLGFRADVGAPRPPAAWAMVGVAGACLWITQQLDVWAVEAQAGALLFSLWRRTDPHPWQRSPIALNLGMLAVVIGTIVVALRGDPSTIALAHFAATTQGLQLLDARPRRTEFLLVALALFQVLLAANLTDSVWFPPLLVVFLFATVWTLIVHTLRSEALEAGVARDVPEVLSAALVRTTAAACLVTVAIAAVLFVLLPRMRSHVLSGMGHGAVIETAGFSDKVAFGELGRIRQDSRVVLRVETLEGPEPSPNEAYWRGLAFDTFDGISWSVTPPERIPVPGSAEMGVSLGRDPQEVNLVQRIVREPVAAGVLFVVGEPRGLQGSVRHLERDPSGGLYAAGQDDERVRYTVRSERRVFSDRELERDRAVVPGPGGERYLGLPPLSPAFVALARRIAGGQTSDAARARALERYLQQNGHYTDTPPPLDPKSPLSPVERFALGDMAGHCEYFASAMVLLARVVGLPARLVNGFAGGRENPIGGFVELTRSDAHAWVEIHYARAGWVRYDPTPADLRASADPAPTLAERMHQLGSALELWWFQRVVGFDRSDQVDALRRAWWAWRGRASLHAHGLSTTAAGASGLGGPWKRRLAVAGAALAALALAAALLRAARRHPPALPASYAKAMRLLARRGLLRSPCTTSRAFAREVRERLSPAAAEAFDRLTEQYLAERFGGAPSHPGESALRALRIALRSR